MLAHLVFGTPKEHGVTEKNELREEHGVIWVCLAEIPLLGAFENQEVAYKNRSLIRTSASKTPVQKWFL